MAIVTRLGRLVRADLHAVLDQLEEPQLLLRQALREMDEQLAQRRAQIKLREAEHGQLQARLAECNRRLLQIGEELDLAFSAGSEALQRGLLRRRLEVEALARGLNQRLEALHQVLASLREELAAQHGQYEALRQQAEAVTSTQPGTELPVEAPGVSDADIELALLRERQRRGVS